MKSRSARLSLLVLFVVALGVTAYLFRKSEAARRTEMAAAQSFNERGRAAVHGVLDLRSAQQAYVATGQGAQTWAARVSRTFDSVRQNLTALRSSASTPQSQAQYRRGVRGDPGLAQMDTRAREYVRTNQNMLASDMIFSNGGELTDAAVGALDKAMAAETAARSAAAETFNRRETFALVTAAAAACLVVLLLLPRCRNGAAVAVVCRRAPRARCRHAGYQRRKGGSRCRSTSPRRGCRGRQRRGCLQGG